MLRNLCLAVLVGTCAVASLPASARADGSEVYVGASAAPNSLYGYIGGVTAINQNLGSDGFLVRALAGYGGYSYGRTGLSTVDGQISNGDVMVGYHHYFTTDESFLKGGLLTGYIGGDVQDESLDQTDLLNKARGTEFGVKGALEARLDFTNDLNADLAGDYSTAFDTYWTRGRVGYNVTKLTSLNVSVGPEASFLGNRAYDEQRVGAFIGDIHLIGSLTATVSGGYSNSSRSGGVSGAYGDAGLDVTF